MTKDEDTKPKHDEAERDMAGRADYPYMDQTRASLTEVVRESADTPAVLNPAYYPPSAKPEGMHNEVEKAGAEFPTHAHPDEVEDRSQKASDITEAERANNPALTDPTVLQPGQIVIPPTHTPAGDAAGDSKARRVPAASTSSTAGQAGQSGGQQESKKD